MERSSGTNAAPSICELPMGSTTTKKKGGRCKINYLPGGLDLASVNHQSFIKSIRFPKSKQCRRHSNDVTTTCYSVVSSLASPTVGQDSFHSFFGTNVPLTISCDSDFPISPCDTGLQRSISETPPSMRRTYLNKVSIDKLRESKSSHELHVNLNELSKTKIEAFKRSMSNDFAPKIPCRYHSPVRYAR